MTIEKLLFTISSVYLLIFYQNKDPGNTNQGIYFTGSFWQVGKFLAGWRVFGGLADFLAGWLVFGGGLAGFLASWRFFWRVGGFFNR